MEQNMTVSMTLGMSGNGFLMTELSIIKLKTIIRVVAKEYEDTIRLQAMVKRELYSESDLIEYVDLANFKSLNRVENSIYYIKEIHKFMSMIDPITGEYGHILYE